MVADVESGRTPASVIAKHLGISERSLRDNIKARKEIHAQQATYATFDKWSQVPGSREYEAWIRNRVTGGPKGVKGEGLTATRWINAAERIWQEVFHKKNPQLLNKADFVEAANWVRALPEGSRHGMMLIVRSLIRSGFAGKYEWLASDLSTKGLKFQRDFPPEFTNPDTLREVIPRLYASFAKMRDEKLPTRGFNTPPTWLEVETLELGIDVKRAFGPRTGNTDREMELWGMKINAGKSPVYMTNGEVQSLKWFAKGGFNWGPYNRKIIATNGKLIEHMERYVREYELHDGDPLMNNLSQARAWDILNEGCRIAGLSALRLHDFRKMYASVAILNGVPMEKFCDMGVGWHDVSTLKKFYVTLKPANIEESYATMAEFQNLA
jgi:hypothetical protein